MIVVPTGAHLTYPKLSVGLTKGDEVVETIEIELGGRILKSMKPFKSADDVINAKTTWGSPFFESLSKDRAENAIKGMKDLPLALAKLDPEQPESASSQGLEVPGKDKEEKDWLDRT